MHDFVGETADIVEGESDLVSVIVAPEQGALARLLFGPSIDDVETEVEISRRDDLVILLEVLVRIEFDTRKEFFKHARAPYSAIMVRKVAGVSPPHFCPCGYFGLKYMLSPFSRRNSLSPKATMTFPSTT